MVDDLDIKFPDIYINNEKSHMYDELDTNPESPFRGTTQAAVFIFAMAYAKKNRMAPKKFKAGRVRLEGTAFGLEMRTLMRSLMIDEKNDVYAIGDNTPLRKLCEEYANAGIDTLYDKIIRNRSPGTSGEDVLVDLLRS